MKKLFLRAFGKVMDKVGVKVNGLRVDSQELVKIIEKKYRDDIPYSKLTRLPYSEIKNMLKMPCPLDDSRKVDDQMEELAVFKRLRHNFNVEQGPVCFKCKRICPLRTVPFKQLEFKPKTTNKSALHDMCLYLLALSSTSQNIYSELRWSSAYKVSSSLQILLNDFKVLSRESLLFREVFKGLDEEEREFLNKHKSKKVKISEDIHTKLKDRRIKLPQIDQK